MKTGLLLIDLQNDYFPGGAMELKGSNEAAEVASGLLSFFRQRRLPVIHIQHLSVRPGATFFIPGTPGVSIHPAVTPQEGETVIQKHYPNSFRETALLETLQHSGIERLVIAGMMTHMCVDSTTRAATDFGYQCQIVRDGCATRDLTLNGQVVPAELVHSAFLAALNGVYGRVVTADTAMAECRD